MPIRRDDLDLANSEITRRDFVGGALLGTGSMLLGMASPAAVRTAAAQTSSLPMTGLGPDWTGPGGIGDYARSNGNTFEVVNAAHGAIRNHDRDGAAVTDTGESYDLVIVGCGISGLAAAYTYHKERPGSSVLMLDQHPIFGGEAKQEQIGPLVACHEPATGPRLYPHRPADMNGPEAGSYWVVVAKQQFPRQYRQWARMTVVGRVTGMQRYEEPVLSLLYVRGWGIKLGSSRGLGEF